MSVRIALDNRPEFYTNLDRISGRVLLKLRRPEQVATIVVKLEGESATALQVPNQLEADPGPGPRPGPPGSIATEVHKVLYKVQQVFPDDYHASASSPHGAFPMQPGEHAFSFSFKLPINNACSDPMAMSKIGGLGGLGGFGTGSGLFGTGGVRVMDGSKQLFLKHVTRTLPPSLTGFPMEAEVRYYIKVTVQRPGLLKENWRFQLGLKFLPIEPPRPPLTGHETYARRPWTFRPRSPSLAAKMGGSLLGTLSSSAAAAAASSSSSSPKNASELGPGPSVEMSARLPHPAVLTCNQPVPLRLIAKKLTESRDPVWLVSFQMDLIGLTQVRTHNLYDKKINRWTVVSKTKLAVPLTTAEVGRELVVDNSLWADGPLPNTIAPSFMTCNLARRYELELKLGLRCGKARAGMAGGDGSSAEQTIVLPLHFAQLEVYSGIAPPPELVEAAKTRRPGRATLELPPPRLPPRNSLSGPSSPVARPGLGGQEAAPATSPRPARDPLYPPQLGPGQTEAPYEDAPPSYDEAMAENLSGPFDGSRPRPAYSGMSNEDGPSQMPAQKG